MSYTCAWCSNTASPTFGGHMPNGWVTKKNSMFTEYRFCSNKCLSEFNKQQSAGQDSKSTNSGSEIDHAAIAQANAEKAAIELETQRHEEQMSLERRKQELEETKNRQKRADELRAQGKNFHATVVEYNLMTVFGIAAFLIIGAGVIGYMNYSSKNVAKEAGEINLKLEGIEDQIKIAIQDGKRDKALELTSQLIHPMHEKWEEKFGFMSGDVYYDDWWSQKRKEYKDQVMQMSVTTTAVSSEEQAPAIETKPEQETELKPAEAETPNYSNLPGEWHGAFGKDEIALTISAVNSDGSVTGYDVVKGNQRALIGTVIKNGDAYIFELKEPGDEQWDGVFKFSISGTTATGNWASNNGKSTKQFTLTK